MLYPAQKPYHTPMDFFIPPFLQKISPYSFCFLALLNESSQE
jgi:hypothetical protein